MAKRIINKGDWFLVEIIEVCEPVKVNSTSRVTTWGNYCLICAKTPAEAYDKAVKAGKRGNYIFTSNGSKMRWKFAGIGNLLPIYEDLEDGAEIMWNDYGYIGKKRVKKIVSSKKKLLKGIKLKKD